MVKLDLSDPMARIIGQQERITEYIPLSECESGFLYRVYARNFKLGVFCAKNGEFYGIREKFGKLYVFCEQSWDKGPPFGTVLPLEKLEKCPITTVGQEFMGDGPLFDWLQTKQSEILNKKLVSYFGKTEVVA